MLCCIEENEWLWKKLKFSIEDGKVRFKLQNNTKVTKVRAAAAAAAAAAATTAVASIVVFVGMLYDCSFFPGSFSGGLQSWPIAS